MIYEDLIRDCLGENIKINNIKTKLPMAPGQIKHHYQPEFDLHIVFSSPPDIDPNLIWEIPDNPQKAARELYAKMREKDQYLKENSEIHKKEFYFTIDPKWQEQDEWQGILNRLQKARFKK
jgi:hypothetical protein